MSNFEKRNGSNPEKAPGRPPMEKKVWIPPDDTPEWVINEMPVEEVADTDLVWQFLYPEKPDWWNPRYGLGVVNLRRKEVYELWLNGELKQFPKDDQ